MEKSRVFQLIAIDWAFFLCVCVFVSSSSFIPSFTWVATDDNRKKKESNINDMQSRYKTQRHFMYMRVIVVEYDGGSGNGGVVVLAMVDPDHTATKQKQQKLTQQKPAQTRRRPWPPFFFLSLSLSTLTFDLRHDSSRRGRFGSLRRYVHKVNV
jgi:hypothetical protein